MPGQLRLAANSATPATSTGDVQNRAAVRAVAGAKLDLVGPAVHGPKNAVDKVMKGAHMHP
ncbi:DUF2000 family protein [Blastococcus tunisiensis]|uniref:Uncharacterized protein n=1 Tax=Blastococcus tunisiensis TaxID=1798228 RepID=A0A1I2HQ23_9ACTN|nr:DUF2000 family protein [Blastococcus sp. DSM 46838]SFF32214.1 Protein of unknown function [Blastococcus sp. DSM 46838]